MSYQVSLLLALSGILVAVAPLAQTVSTAPKKITLQCGQHVVAIVCGKVFDPSYPNDKRECNSNTLSFWDMNGKAYLPSMPKALDRAKTPVSLDCALGNDNNNYVTVEFSSGPEGCRPCLTYFLFDELGNRLTSDASDRMAEYGSAVKKLGIRYAKKNHIERAGK